MYVSFNGGKDATVTVFIMYFAMMGYLFGLFVGWALRGGR